MATPTPQPAALKLVGGRSPGRDSGGRPVKTPPKFRRIPPNPPTWLSREAKAEWKRVVPELARLDLLKTADRAALTAYCECWARHVQAVRMTSGYDDDGMPRVLSVNSQGVTRSPALAILEAASKELRGWAAEFGLTPSAESRVSPGGDHGPSDDNPFG